jgi:hypothetical protein
MSTITLSNEAILELHAEDLEAIRQEHGLLAAVEAANRLIELTDGEVGPDGVYYPRRPQEGGGIHGLRELASN